MNNTDTIFALSSGHGKSGVAVIRVSGENLNHMAHDMIGRDAVARRAYFVNLRDMAGDLIDQCLVLYFPAPHSFTGQDVIEIQCHGAPAVISKIFDDLRDRGARMAVPGEFSRRAFDNGKMDLADIDGLAALLDAATERQRRAAIHAITGDGAQYNAWRHDMIEIAAYAAAITDYADDELPPDIWDRVQTRAKKLYDQITHALGRADVARTIRGGFNIVIAGPTNAGKSSLFNRIVGANRAIVSDTPGTTRDVVNATLDIDGYMVNLADTAGLRATNDDIEKIGIQKAHDEIQNADLVINVCAAGDTHTSVTHDNVIRVINKSDLITSQTDAGAIYISAMTGNGIDDLMRVVHQKIHNNLDGAESDIAVNARTREHLDVVCAELNNAINADVPEIFAEHVRAAADAIGQILGTISTSDVLDAAFSQLCLGK